MSECHTICKAYEECAVDTLDMLYEVSKLMDGLGYRIEGIVATIEKLANKVVIADVESALIEVLISAENLETSIQSLEDVLDEC